MGVFKSVKIKPNETVSVEKERFADGESVISSLIQDEMQMEKIANKINNIFLKAFI